MTADSRDPRPQPAARLGAAVMVVRKGHILDAAEAGPLQPGDYGYFLVSRDRAAAARQPVPREPGRGAPARAHLRRAADPRRDQGGGGRAVLRPRLRPARPGDHRSPTGRRPARASPRSTPCWRSPAARLVVRRLESGRIASIGLQLDELLQVEPDERLLARLEEEADDLRGLRSWLARSAPAAPAVAGVSGLYPRPGSG